MAIKTYKKEVNRGVNHHNARWSQKQKLEAVAMWRLIGNLRIVSDSLGIPYDTIKKWPAEDWWREAVAEMGKEVRAKTNSRLTKIAEKALEVVYDRLENGDFHINTRTGAIERKPLNALTANKIAVDSIDKQVLFERLEREHQQVLTEEKLVDRIEKISEAFLKMARQGRQKPLGDVIEGELVQPHTLSNPDAPEPV